MTKWQLIIETYNALPETDRTSRKVHTEMLKDGHSLCFDRVQEVLSATVLSELISADDVRVTAKTLKTLCDICSSNMSTHVFGRSEPETDDLTFANHFLGSLSSIAGPSALDLAEVLASILVEYRADTEADRQIAYIEQMHELERRQKENPDDEDLVF